MASSPQTVLLVDDESDILLALQRYLEDALGDVRVLTAPGGREALEVLGREPVDLILSDFKMPHMDGLQLLRAAAQQSPDVPRIMMTAFPDMDLAISALNDGRIQHFLTKPLDPEMTREVLKALLDERRARRQREAALARSLEQMKRRGVPPAGSGR